MKLFPGCPVFEIIITFISVYGTVSGQFDPGMVDPDTSQTMPEMILLWNDEFDYVGRPDSANWAYETGFVRNHELQWYQAENAKCQEGRLVIYGKRERIKNPGYDASSGDWRKKRPYADYTSSCLHTRGLHQWTGPLYIEVKARIDTTQGAWPAIWLLGSSGHWPSCGEIDVMEFYRIEGVGTILANVAWASEDQLIPKWDSRRIPLETFLEQDKEWTEKFHIWSMRLVNDHIKLYLDGQVLNSTSLSETLNPDGQNPFSAGQEFYLLLNLAIGSNGGTPKTDEFPISFEVDYVRVYQIQEEIP